MGIGVTPETQLCRFIRPSNENVDSSLHKTLETFSQLFKIHLEKFKRCCLSFCESDWWIEILYGCKLNLLRSTRWTILWLFLLTWDFFLVEEHPYWLEFKVCFNAAWISGSLWSWSDGWQWETLGITLPVLSNLLTRLMTYCDENGETRNLFRVFH